MDASQLLGVATTIAVALLEGPLRDSNWKRRVSADLKLAGTMRACATSKAERRTSEEVRRRAFELAEASLAREGSMNGILQKLRATWIMPLGILLLTVANLPRTSLSPKESLERIVTAAVCGFVLDATSPGFLGKRPDEQAEGREQHRHKEISDRVPDKESKDAVGESHSSPNPKDIGH